MECIMENLIIFAIVFYTLIIALPSLAETKGA